MKIVHVLSGLTKGGGERVVMELANQAVNNGDEVTILAGWSVDPAFLQNKIDPAVKIKFIAGSKAVAYLKMKFWILSNRKWICSQDVLHCHLTFGAIFGTATYILLKKILRNKTPLIIETNHAVGMPVPPFKRWVQSKMVLLRDGMVLMAVDPYWKNFIAKKTALKTRIIPNGISMHNHSNDPGQKELLLKHFGIPADHKYLIGSISMLRADRNPLLYVPVFAAVHKALGDGVHFILGGSGDEAEKIQKLVKELGLEKNFHLVGLVNEPADIITNLDLYISVSVGETAGISMIEAALCSVPVIAIQLTADYKTKPTDWFWSDNESTGVAGKIISLLQNSTERKQLAQTQYAFAIKNFSAEAMYNAYDLFYKSLFDPDRHIEKT